MIHVVGPIAVAGAMPYALTLIGKSRGFSTQANKETRAWQEQLSGWQKRAHWAHQNSFEAFPLFAVMTILAYMAQPTSVIAISAAWAFVGLRVAYAACYLADWAQPRSIVWYFCMGAIVVLMLVAFGVL